MKHSVRCECDACRGSGLYRGFCEGDGEAVVCVRCGGKGWVVIEYTEFTGRKRRKGVKTIKLSRGSFVLTGVGGHGESMTYAEFEERYKP